MAAIERDTSVPDAAPVPLIQVRGVVKSYEGRVVLDGIDLTIDRGETCVLIGGSGSGKTTLARMVIGLTRPTRGQILIDGEDLAAMSDRTLTTMRRRFAMVFQSHALLDSLTVFDNVAFPLREELHLEESEIEGRVLAALDELEIADAAAKVPSELSGGMAKRVGIARAVVTEPEILVYDEPTSGLDPVSSRIVDGLIERMRESHCVTSLVITHDMVTAYEVADRVVLLADAKVKAQGSPEELFRSHGKELEAFALSSGVDIAKLAPRKDRPSPEEIRERWRATHPPGAYVERRTPQWTWPWSRRARA
jgi:phospholipid/cholesterol/gamma-HCH transport system ATP-binding protein